jgi:hypothetical protein
MVSVPVRGPPAGLAANDKDTLPLPLPLPPEVTVIHGAPLAAVHEQPATEVT